MTDDQYSKKSLHIFMKICCIVYTVFIVFIKNIEINNWLFIDHLGNPSKKKKKKMWKIPHFGKFFKILEKIQRGDPWKKKFS